MKKKQSLPVDYQFQSMIDEKNEKYTKLIAVHFY